MPVELLKFNHQAPLGEDILRGQVAWSANLELREAIPRRTLHIVANGPSARDLPDYFLAEDTLALNGALEVCLSKGFAPTYWAACDPQQLVEDFLLRTPWETIYLVASKCHPDVFERLGGYDLRIWHVGDVECEEAAELVTVRHGSSITLTALHLARHLGYTDLQVWGWDCCLLDGEHHGAGSAPPKDTTVLDLRRAPDAPPLQAFTTTLPWASEVEQALGHITELRAWGVNVTVHGPGMVRAALDFLDSLETSDDA